MSSTKDEIHTASDPQVRAILRALCDDKAVRARALNHLRTLQAADRIQTGHKRSAAGELAVCVQCDDAFTPEDNTSKACRRYRRVTT